MFEISKEIETTLCVEKCLILKLSGKYFVDGREYKIPSDEVFMDDIIEE